MEHQTLCSSSPPRSVSFAPSAKVRRALHINDYTKEERQATYFTRADNRKFKQEAKITANLIDNEQSVNDNDDDSTCNSCSSMMGFCVRGVESMTTQGFATQSIRRKTALLAVLKEQDRLHTNHRHHHPEQEQDEDSVLAEDEHIAAVYGDAVRESVASAYSYGLADERAAAALQQQQQQDTSKVPPPPQQRVKDTLSPSSYNIKKQSLISIMTMMTKKGGKHSKTTDATPSPTTTVRRTKRVGPTTIRIK